MNNKNKQENAAVMITALLVNPYILAIGLIVTAGLFLASIGAIANLVIGK